MRKLRGIGYRSKKDFLKSLSDKQFVSLKLNYTETEDVYSYFFIFGPLIFLIGVLAVLGDF